MSSIKRVLVPTDFSPASDIAFNYALDMAWRQGATLHLLHVIDDVHLTVGYPDGLYAEAPGLRAQLTEAANNGLTLMAAKCLTAHVPNTFEVVIGRPVQRIVEIAEHRGSDLIVMGTHGRSGFAHLMLGSVTERVLRLAPCAVLTIRDTSRMADAIAAEAVACRHASVAATNPQPPGAAP